MKRSIMFCFMGIVLIGMAECTLVLAAGPETEKGKMLYEGKKCGLCHAINGKGGKKGTDLSDTGNKRDAGWLMKYLKDPKGTLPGAKMMPVKASPEELSALIDYMLSLKK